MSYTINFDGQLSISPPLLMAENAYLTAFGSRRRVAIDETGALLRDPLREAVGMPFGPCGMFAVRHFDQEWIPNQNAVPGDVPGYWCAWIPSTHGDYLVPRSGCYWGHAAWLEFLIECFLSGWGHVLDGEVTWQGERPDDQGVIRVSSNVVFVERFGGEEDEPVRLNFNDEEEAT